MALLIRGDSGDTGRPFHHDAKHSTQPRYTMKMIQNQSAMFTGIPVAVAAVEPDFKGLDSAEDIIRDASKWGLIEDLRKLLREGANCDGIDGENGEDCRVTRIVRDIVYELAGAKDRDFAVDLFIHVTGIAEFGQHSLRDYARKHNCSHEWFRKEAEAMRRRLGLTIPPSA